MINYRGFNSYLFTIQILVSIGPLLSILHLDLAWETGGGGGGRGVPTLPDTSTTRTNLVILNCQ